MIEDNLSTALADGRCFLDGNKWCFLVGDDLVEGTAGFGDTPGEALDDLLENMNK